MLPDAMCKLYPARAPHVKPAVLLTQGNKKIAKDVNVEMPMAHPKIRALCVHKAADSPREYELAEVPFLDDRDFLYWEVTQRLPGDIHIIFGQSLTANEEAACSDVPHQKGVIRGEMGASGGYSWPQEQAQDGHDIMLLSAV